MQCIFRNTGRVFAEFLSEFQAADTAPYNLLTSMNVSSHPPGNFYTSGNGEKGCKTQKSGASCLKIQAEAPLWRILLRFAVWTSTANGLFRISSEKPVNPWFYWTKRLDIYFVTVIWRRRRDSNPRAGYPTYALSRGASSPTWVLLRVTYSINIKLAERVGFEPTVPCGITGFQDQLLKPLGHLSNCIARTVKQRYLLYQRRL